MGGTQSVIRIIRDYSIGADTVRALSTWDGPNQLHNARLVAIAASELRHASRATVAHFHISRGGAWLREGALLRVAHARGLRIAVTLHGGDIAQFAGKHPRTVQLGLSKADHVICLSDETAAVVGRLLPEMPVTIMPNPIEIDPLAGSAANSLPVALFAGRIGKRKGVDVLIEAWQTLVDAGVDGQCRLVGPTDDFVPPKVARMSVEPAVHPNQVGGILREARVVVLPSRAEGMPMILTEALAARRPFVATDVGGTRDITPDPEMIVPVGDSLALAAAMKRYLLDSTAAGVAGDLGQQYVARTRSPEVIDRRLRDIYAAMR